MYKKSLLIVGLLVLLFFGLGFVRLEKAAPVRPLVYRALISHVDNLPNPVYEAVVYENSLGTQLTFSRPLTGTFELHSADPLFSFSSTFIMTSVYNDGILTPETIEASVKNPQMIQFLHYMEMPDGLMQLSNGLLGGHAYGTAFYVWIVVNK